MNKYIFIFLCCIACSANAQNSTNKKAQESFDDAQQYLRQNIYDQGIKFLDEAVKIERRGELMLAQQAISLAKNQAKLGSVYEVLVEGKIEGYYTGRSYEMAPEIDGEVLIQTNRELIAGTWVKVKITEALEYDLIGEVYHESSK